MTEWKKRAKDSSPEETVEKIIKILDENGIKTEYTETPLDVPGCYSSRVNVIAGKSKSFGTNGKGSTPSFCKASAYAELMERLQNRVTMPPVYSLSERFKSLAKKYIDKCPYDYEAEAAKEGSLLNLYVDALAKTSNLYKISPEYAKTGVLLMIEEIMGGQKKYIGNKIYNYTKDRDELFSIETFLNFFGSNGMASGNTIEEAIVQATCEIFERMALAAMLRDHVAFPDIPREDAFKDQYIKDVVTEIESRGYRVLMKDASMGKGLPVVGAFIIDKDNHTLSFHMGSHPSMAVALERVFTETMQGIKLKDAVRLNSVSFAQNSEYQNFNAIKVGMAPVPADCLLKKPDYEYTGWNEIKATDNKAMAKKMLDLLGTFGHDVYIFDASCMGFPTVFVLSPLVSDAHAVDISTLKTSNRCSLMQQAFRRLDKLDEKEVRKIREYVLLQRYAILENGPEFSTALPISDFIQTDFFGQIAAYCTYRLGNIKDASLLLKQVASYNPNNSYIKAQSIYLSALNSGKTKEEALRIIKILATDEMANKVEFLFSEPEKVLERGLPHCTGDCKNCKNTNCLENDHIDFYIKLIDKLSNYDKGGENIKKALDL